MTAHHDKLIRVNGSIGRGVIAACALALLACSGQDNSSTDGSTPMDGGVHQPLVDGGRPDRQFPDVILVPLPDAGPCSDDPIGDREGSGGGPSAKLKSPSARMHFTVDQPLRILAEEGDGNEWMCPPGHPPYVCDDTRMEFFVDGVLMGTLPPNPDGQSHWELRLPGISELGDHLLDVRYYPHLGGDPANAGNPTIITIDPMPSHAMRVTLDQDLVLSGSTPLDWTDTTVIGNGHVVRSADGYTGRVTIASSAVYGLGDYDGVGIDIQTTGEVSLTGSMFEATAPVHIASSGSAPFTVTGNEFRANNLVTYIAGNPDATPVVVFDANTSGAKTMQGNRFGGGIVRIRGAAGWQIGGTHAGEGNILIGPRAVLDCGADGAIIQGNYLHHVYRGGWSQGFNLFTPDAGTIEHNVIYEGSWPIQSVGGLFRYNLVVDSGHDWWRSARPNAVIYRNIFVHTSGPDGGFNGGLLFYGAEGESGIVINGNTFDAGGADSNFYAPAIVIEGGSVVSSIRNNVFTGFADNTWGFVVGTGDTPGTLTSADYNAFSNPDGPGLMRYDPVIVTGAGGHDVMSAPAFARDRDRPYGVRDGCIWEGSQTPRDVLIYYRGMYTPTSASPLVGAGDPSDGAGTDIGAVDGDGGDPTDLFGSVLE